MRTATKAVLECLEMQMQVMPLPRAAKSGPPASQCSTAEAPVEERAMDAQPPREERPLDDAEYLVDNTGLQAESRGISSRKDMAEGRYSEKYARWGSRVRGYRVGHWLRVRELQLEDGWSKIKDRYLPMCIKGIPVIVCAPAAVEPPPALSLVKDLTKFEQPELVPFDTSQVAPPGTLRTADTRRASNSPFGGLPVSPFGGLRSAPGIHTSAQQSGHRSAPPSMSLSLFGGPPPIMTGRATAAEEFDILMQSRSLQAQEIPDSSEGSGSEESTTIYSKPAFSSSETASMHTLSAVGYNTKKGSKKKSADGEEAESKYEETESANIQETQNAATCEKEAGTEAGDPGAEPTASRMPDASSPEIVGERRSGGCGNGRGSGVAP